MPHRNLANYVQRHPEVLASIKAGLEQRRLGLRKPLSQMMKEKHDG